MRFKEIYGYYSRPEVQQALLRASKGREVAGVFKEGRYSSRPNMLVYANDILSQAKNGVIAFHGSLERWENPMAVGSENYEKTRGGWDLVIDLDIDELMGLESGMEARTKLELGRLAAKSFAEALRKHEVKNFGIKFTGGTSFHLGIPWESFPKKVDYKPTKEQYPELARKIVLYLRDFAREKIESMFFARYSPEELASMMNKPLGTVLDGFVAVDSVLVSPRHLFRLPYSLHEKSGLVSLPLTEGQLDGFKREDAEPWKVKCDVCFLDPGEEGEAELLVAEAVDWHSKRTRVRERKPGKRRGPLKAVPLKFAPPCVKNIIIGLPDGRKRSVLILINYLSTLKWGWDEIEKTLVEWNQKNKPPLGENYIKSQIRWHSRRGKELPPPNCDNKGYYESFGVCKPDPVCGGSAKTIKNPVSYAMRRYLKKR